MCMLMLMLGGSVEVSFSRPAERNHCHPGESPADAVSDSRSAAVALYRFQVVQ